MTEVIRVRSICILVKRYIAMHIYSPLINQFVNNNIVLSNKLSSRELNNNNTQFKLDTI